MEEKAPSRCSVAELAGRFKGSTPSNSEAGNERDKPVRRRPPRSLHIPKPPGDEQEQPSGITSPVPKAKRNSALIEKLQANLVLSPTAMLHSPMSPGFKLVPPSFSPLSPGSSPVSPSSTATPSCPLTASAVTEEEGPVSFEDPIAVAEGSVLSNINKGRVRHSLRRRPPSRRHRVSSSGNEVVSDGADPTLTSQSEPQDKTMTGDEGGGGGGVFEKEDKTEEVEDTSTRQENDDAQSKAEPKAEDEQNEEQENGSKGGEEEEHSSMRQEMEEEEKEKEKKEEEEKAGEKQNEDSTEDGTNAENKAEEKQEMTSSAR